MSCSLGQGMEDLLTVCLVRIEKSVREWRMMGARCLLLLFTQELDRRPANFEL